MTRGCDGFTRADVYVCEEEEIYARACMVI